MPLADLAKSRRRTVEENHKRSLDLQILDALLRIEEQLIKFGQVYYKMDEDGIAEVIPLEDVLVNLTPTPTPFSKAIAAKPKGTRGKVDRL